jgi:3-hydroxyisobutyrate dehydrogenase-like beta-hydroxyacid dehydrogenase
MGDKIVDNLSVAVLGLGEAGGTIAGDLVRAGVRVRGYDPLQREIEGLATVDSAEAAVESARVVLSVNSAHAAVEVAVTVRGVLAPGQLFADLNTASPALKAELAAVVETGGAQFVDVALMGTVPGNGLLTPCLVSGSGARAYADLFGPLGTPVEVVDGEAGQAAERKLLRSVFMKGMAAAAIESLAAAHAAGCEEWLHDELAQVFATASPALLDRLLAGSERHAARRVHEMQAAIDMLGDLGVEPRVSNAALGWLSRLEAESHAG